MGTGYMTLTFRNGSIMDILTPLASTRGNRATAGIIDEYRQIKINDSEKVEFFIIKTHFYLEINKRRN